jgi:hypothetical protein
VRVNKVLQPVPKPKYTDAELDRLFQLRLKNMPVEKLKFIGPDDKLIQELIGRHGNLSKINSDKIAEICSEVIRAEMPRAEFREMKRAKLNDEFAEMCRERLLDESRARLRVLDDLLHYGNLHDFQFYAICREARSLRAIISGKRCDETDRLKNNGDTTKLSNLDPFI